jgi:hypothetical protein
MFYQGVRSDLSELLKKPSIEMYDAARKLVIDTLFASVYGDKEVLVLAEHCLFLFLKLTVYHCPGLDHNEIRATMEKRERLGNQPS